MNTNIDGPTFVALMERYGIKPSQLGITPNYKARLKKGERKPSAELVRKLFKLIEAKDDVGSSTGNNGIKTSRETAVVEEGLERLSNQFLSIMKVLKLVEEYSKQYVYAVQRVSAKIQEIDVKLSRMLMIVYEHTNARDLTLELKPSVQGREILETVVAKVLRDLGFEVSTNIVVASLTGSSLELDVLGRRMVCGMPFYVYVTCKNLSKHVDRDIVARELGRLLLMPFKPHLSLLVVSNIDRSAKLIANRVGFVVIEVGFKVSEENADKAYIIIRKSLEELFKWNAEEAVYANRCKQCLVSLGC